MPNVGPYNVDWKTCELDGPNGRVRLTPIQTRVLRLLVNARGKVVTKDRFHHEIWNGQAVEDGSLSQSIFLLRKALGKLPDGGEVIETVPRKGYRLSTRALRAARAGRDEGIAVDTQRGTVGDEPFRILVDSIEDYAIYLLDCAGRVVTWNKGAERIAGFTPNDIIGRHYSLFFVPEEVQARIPEREMAVAATRGRSAGEGWRIRKNGERFWAAFALTALRTPGGTLRGFAKILKDLTDAKRDADVLARTEAELRRERDRLQAAAESSLDALFICETLKDPSGEIEDFVFTYLNRNVEDIVPIPRARLLGGRMRELLPFHVESGLFDAYKQVVLTGIPFLAEVAIQSPSATANWLRIQAVRLDEGVAITASDISRQKKIRSRRTPTPPSHPVLGRTAPEAGHKSEA